MTQSFTAGIIGCGNITLGGHARILKALPDVHVVGIADPTLDRRRKVQELLGLPDEASLADYRDLLALKPDYVVLTTPQRARPEIVLACARAGVHVLSEKPIATIPAEAHQMVEAMRAANLKLGLNHNYLYYPEYTLARELIAQGEIGELRHVTLNFLGVPDYPGAAEYRPSWRHDPVEAGGGILMDMIHAVYLTEYLMNDQIQAVSAVVDNLDHPGDRVEDFTIVNYHFMQGYATINMWWGNGPGGVEFSGTRGRILAFYQNYGTGPFTQLDQFILVNEQGMREFHPREDAKDVQPFVRIHQDFLEAMRSGCDPVATGEAGERALQATLAAYQAGVTGHGVTIPYSVDHPVYQKGVAGFQDLDLWKAAPAFRRGIFGLG